MKTAFLLLFLFVATTEARQTRSVKGLIIQPTAGDTYDVLVGPKGQTLTKAGTAGFLTPYVLVSKLVVGRTYDFSSIVWRGSLRSVQPLPLHYTITRDFNQTLWGVWPGWKP